jgi:GST-like protein
MLGTQADPYAAARYRTQSERLYECLEKRLAIREWVAGDLYSIADMAIYPWALYLEPHGFDPDAHPALIRWRDAIAAREAVQRSWSRFAVAFNQVSQESRRTATAQTLDRFFGRDPANPPADYSSILRG